MSEGTTTGDRVLGIDFGQVRIGVACSDEIGLFAHPLETIVVEKTQPIPRIVELVREKGVSKVVLGMPYHLNGQEGASVEAVKDFQSELEQALPDIPLLEVDERLTTVEAQRQLAQSGKTTRETKGVIDQAAAVLILQTYLDGQAPLPDPWETGEDDEW
ncbi:MAG: Holliday junction resolvase RuvX [Verrucomicrobiota bacterium]